MRRTRGPYGAFCDCRRNDGHFSGYPCRHSWISNIPECTRTSARKAHCPGAACT
ncbi:SWIM zinc finger family protein [Modicisalibacter muralis]|uniref:SWIM zinc finger family protein n=1 Tax=Modicisalibacter muralis TaxID=119000 RepID=UPI00338E7051